MRLLSTQTGSILRTFPSSRSWVSTSDIEDINLDNGYQRGCCPRETIGKLDYLKKLVSLQFSQTFSAP